MKVQLVLFLEVRHNLSDLPHTYQSLENVCSCGRKKPAYQDLNN